MHCPRCGTENDEGDRFCSNCGASLRPTRSAERRSLSEYVARSIGTTRKARLLTAGTVLAIFVALIALIALPSETNSGSVPRDAYTISADKICVKAKREIAAAGNRSLTSASRPGAFPASLVPIVAQWRTDFNALGPPIDRTEQAVALDSALRDVEITAAGLALAAQRGTGDIEARARRVDQLTGTVESAIRDLGLTDCAHAQLALRSQPTPQG